MDYRSSSIPSINTPDSAIETSEFISSSSEDDEEDLEGIDCKQNTKQKTLKDLIEPVSKKYNLDKAIKTFDFTTCVVGATNGRINPCLRAVAAVLWILSLSFHFACDIYEAYFVYGYTFLTAQILWLTSFIILTWATAYRTLPCLVMGLKELREDKCYEKTITRLLSTLKKVPYGLFIFSIIGAAIQHGLLYKDKAIHVDFNQNLHGTFEYILHVVRFISSVHVYFAYGLFWVIPTGSMLATGGAMTEFMDQMGSKMRDKARFLTFKDAIGGYLARANFVKSSSSRSFVVLTVLITTGIVCFGLNTYIFLIKNRRYLHVWHSLLPMLVMIYPLCTAAWVTKQYNMFIIVVVRAWVQRNDLDESSSDDSGIDDNHPLQTSQTKRLLHASKLKLSKLVQKSPKIKVKTNIFRSFSDESKDRLNNSLSVNKDHKVVGRTLSTDVIQAGITLKQATEGIDHGEAEPTKISFAQTVNTAKAVAKFRMAAKIPRFNFEKFLSYLESMRSVVGFQIAGVMVTWDLVSTILFLFFSILAVFLQESIFGSQRSTLES